MSIHHRAPESINQDCLICLANARAGMEALNEVEEMLKGVNLVQSVKVRFAQILILLVSFLEHDGHDIHFFLNEAHTKPILTDL